MHIYIYISVIFCAYVITITVFLYISDLFTKKSVILSIGFCSYDISYFYWKQHAKFWKLLEISWLLLFFFVSFFKNNVTLLSLDNELWHFSIQPGVTTVLPVLDTSHSPACLNLIVSLEEAFVISPTLKVITQRKINNKGSFSCLGLTDGWRFQVRQSKWASNEVQSKPH